jgi:hypothetical protein
VNDTESGTVPVPTVTVTLDPYLYNVLGTLSNGNLTYTWSYVGSFGCAYGTVPKNTGKFYFEVINTTPGNYGYAIYDNWSFCAGISTGVRNTGNDILPGSDATGWGFSNRNSSGLTIDSSTWHNGIPTALTGVPQVPQGGYLGVAVDLDAGKVWFNANGTWVGGGNPAAGTSPAYTFTPNTVMYPAVGQATIGASTANFGVTAFSGVKPSGFLAWNVDAGLTNSFDPISSNANIALTGSNKTAKSTSSALPLGQFYGAISTISHNTGKYYIEFTQDVYVTKSLEVGLVKSTFDMGMPTSNYIGYTADGYGVDVDWAGNLFALNSLTSSTIGTGLTSNGDKVGIAVDFDAGKWWVRRNGTWTNGDPAAGTGGVIAFPFTPNTTLYAAIALNGTVAQVTTNFGDSAFAHTIPSGFSPWGLTNTTLIYDNVGFSGGVATAARSTANGYIPGADANSWGFSNQNNTGLATDSSIRHNGVIDYATMVGIDQIPQNGYLGVAVDFDAGKMWFDVNGSLPYGGSPSTATSPTYTFTPGTVLYPVVGQGGIAPYGSSTANFGATQWIGQLPTGYQPWNGIAVAGLDVEVHATFDATLVDGPTLEPLPLDTALERFSKWDATDQASQPQTFCQLNPAQYILLPKPEAGSTYEIMMTLALKPLRTATGMDEDVFNELEDLIVHGTLQRLLMIPNQNWTDYEMAKYHKRQYLAKLTERRARANLGNMRGPMFVNIPPFS